MKEDWNDANEIGFLAAKLMGITAICRSVLINTDEDWTKRAMERAIEQAMKTSPRGFASGCEKYYEQPVHP